MQMYLGDMRKEPYPTGLLASNLMPLLPQLKSIIFHDNEHGEGAAEAVSAALSRMVDNTNARLRRAGKQIRLIQIVICTKAHHRIKVIYNGTSTGPTESFEVSIYNETRRMKALEKEGGEIEEEPTIGAPRRGAEKFAKKPGKPRKKRTDDYEPHVDRNRFRHDEDDHPTTQRYA